MSSSSSNKQPLMVDRPATTSTLLTVASGQAFSTSLVPTAVGNATKIFDVDSGATDTSISGAYIDEIWLRYTKRCLEFIDAQAVTTGTYSANSTTVTVTISGGHNARVGQKVWCDFTSYSSGTVPIDAELTIATVTPTTFTADIPSLSGTITGNVACACPIDICFYLVNVGTVSNTNQFFPLFVSSVEAVGSEVVYSLTENRICLYQSSCCASRFKHGQCKQQKALKSRGLMLKRGQALYAAVSGATALTNGFYVGVQGGFY